MVRVGRFAGLATYFWFAVNIFLVVLPQALGAGLVLIGLGTIGGFVIAVVLAKRVEGKMPTPGFRYCANRVGAPPAGLLA